MKEEWGTIENFPDYEVSSFGNVRSNKRKSIRELIQYPFKQSDYKCVYLYEKGKRFVPKKRNTILVHKLVLLTFVGKPKEGQECNHIDGDKQNNHVPNLEWVSRKENLKHAVDNKLYQRGEQRPTSKLKLYEICRIRKLAKNGIKLKTIATHFKVHPATISRIVSKQSWSHF